MSISVEDVRKAAHLARIRIDDSQIDNIRSSLNRVLDFVEQLNEVDCSGVDDVIKYTSSIHERADIAKPCDASVMDNAPQKECGMFVIPKVVG